MKTPPLSETQFDRLLPDALDPNGGIEDGEIQATVGTVRCHSKPAPKELADATTRAASENNVSD